MSKVPKKPSDQVAPPAAAKQGGDEDFQFSEEQMESSWFRRAISAGLRYTKSRSESSGMKVLPVLDLEDGSASSLPSFKPKLAAAKDAGKATLPPAPPAPPAPQQQQQAPGAASAPAKAAFGPPEKTLFKTAINQFFVNHEQKQQQKQLQAARRRSGHMAANTVMVADDGGSGPIVKRIVVAVMLVAIAGGVYRIFSRSSFSNIAARMHNTQLDKDDPLNESEYVVPKPDRAKIKKTKSNGSGKLRHP